MRRALAAFVLALAPLLAWGQTVSPAVSPTEARAVRQVIEAQLDAFKRDDAPRAFSYAAFDAPIVVGADVVQPVRMTDAEGCAWLALYPMLKEPDGTWRINGCQLARLARQET